MFATEPSLYAIEIGRSAAGVGRWYQAKEKGLRFASLLMGELAVRSYTAGIDDGDCPL